MLIITLDNGRQIDIDQIKFDFCRMTPKGLMYWTIMDDDTESWWSVDEYKEIQAKFKARLKASSLKAGDQTNVPQDVLPGSGHTSTQSRPGAGCSRSSPNGCQQLGQQEAANS